MNVKIKLSNIRGTKYLEPQHQVRLLGHILGRLFGAEEVEMYNYGCFLEVIIKTHHGVGLDEMTLLRYLSDDYTVDVQDELECIEDVDGDKVPITRLTITIGTNDSIYEWITKVIPKDIHLYHANNIF